MNIRLNQYNNRLDRLTPVQDQQQHEVNIMSYEERKQNRIQRMEERADKARQESERQHDRSRALTEGIPAGQPILVGHHSEARHRRTLDKSWNALGKAVEATKKAEYYEEKAESARNNRAISSDDPEAIPKLKGKISALSTSQEKMKAINKAFKAGTLDKLGWSPEQIARMEESLKNVYAHKKQQPFPTWQLSLNNANISRLKKRLALLESQQGRTTTEKEVSGVRVVENAEENRLQIFFPGIPSPMIREALKGRGFRWARTNGCWQRVLSNGATYAAAEVLKLI